jgi:hypothetical protein
MRSLFTGKRVLVLAGLALVAIAGGSFMVTRMGGSKSKTPVAQSVSPAKTPAANVDAAPEVPTDPSIAPGMSAEPAPPGANPPPAAGVSPSPAGASDLAAAVQPADAKGQDLAPGALPAMATEADVFKRRKYTYKSLGRTDPFVSLIAGTSADLETLDPQTLKLVGVLEKGSSRRALVEDARGFGYILHRGDPVARGIVDEVGPDFLVITHSMYGITETVTLTLRSKGQGGSPNGSLN